MRGAAGALEGLRLLHEPGCRRLFAARFSSAFGTAMAPVAMAFGVLELWDTPRLVGYVIASQSAAMLMMQLVGGALADRLSRRQMMVGADLLATSAQLGMAWLLFSGDAEVWMLCALMAVNGVAFAFHWPAVIGFVPEVVDRSDLQPANALFSLSHSTAMGLGGAAAGLIVAFAGAGWAIAIDALTFALSACLLGGIRPKHIARREGSEKLLQALRAGWREFTSHRWLWTIVLQFSLVMAGCYGGMFVVGPIVADRALGGAAAWGWVAGAWGFGLVVGGLLGLALYVRRPLLVGSLGVLLLALPLMALSEPLAVPLIALGAFVAGIGSELFTVLWFTNLHERIPPHMMSRIGAYDAVGSIALMPLGEAAAGPMVEGLGAQRTLWIAAAAVIVPTLAVLCVPEVRSLRSARAEADGR